MNINLSDECIEAKANELREKIGMDYVYNIDMDNVLTRARKKSHVFKVRDEISGELDSAEAFMDCSTHTLILSATTRRGLSYYDRRAKFTAAHELGHYVLGHSGNTKRNPDKDTYLTPTQRIQEVQADKFASYFLVPTKLAKSGRSAQEIAEKFKVSAKAAELAYERVQSVLRREKGEKRRPPAAVVDFLKEAEKHGYKVKSDIAEFEHSAKQTDSSRVVEAERRQKAVMQGYTGDMCSECSNFTMVRNGTCLKCDTCGSTSGCS